MLVQKKLLLLPLLLLLIASSTAAAKTPTAKLKELNRKIATLQTVVASKTKEGAQQQKELKKTELALSTTSVKLQKTAKKLTEQKNILHDLNNKEVALEIKLATQKSYLSAETRATYLSSAPQDYLKMVLNQEDPANISRMLTYYRYIGAARVNVMQNLTATILELKKNSLAIKAHTKTLQALCGKENKEKQQLEKVKLKRSTVLTAINTSLKSENAKLNKMLADKAALEKLLARLSAKQRPGPVIKGNLNLLKGKLLLPTAGKISTETSLQWNGVLITAPEGQEVHAIASGKVVFANWLSGYGLLIIIDHGNGYLSIYGRNNSLLKKVGDKVANGDIIATVGKSGGYEQSALYFAMRYNGDPIDPTKMVN